MSLAVAAKIIEIQKEVSGSFVTLAEITSLSGVAMDRAMEDVTSFGPGLARDRLPILENAIDISLEMNFLDSNFIVFRDQYTTHAKSKYKIILPPPLGTYEFSAYVSRLELLSEFDGVVKASCVLAAVAFPGSDFAIVYTALPPVPTEE